MIYCIVSPAVIGAGRDVLNAQPALGARRGGLHVFYQYPRRGLVTRMPSSNPFLQTFRSKSALDMAVVWFERWQRAAADLPRFAHDRHRQAAVERVQPTARSSAAVRGREPAPLARPGIEVAGRL